MSEISFSMETSRQKPTIKIILLGDFTTGKSTYMESLSNKLHRPKLQDRIECPDCTINQEPYRVELHDPPRGIEEFRSLNPSFYRGAVGVIFLYDQTNYNTFASINSYWSKELEKYRQPRDYELEKPVMMLVRNKCDQSSTNLVSDMEEKALCKELGISIRKKVVSKTGCHVKRSWEALMGHVVKRVSANLKKSEFVSLDATISLLDDVEDNTYTCCFK